MDDKALLTEITRQHEELKREVARLHERASNPPAGTSDDRWREVAMEEVGKLRDCLKKHFELEELDGYLEPVTEKRPTLTRNVHQLRAQHQEILNELDRVEAACRNKAAIADTTVIVFNTLELLRKHEAAESSLVQAVLNDDMGSVD